MAIDNNTLKILLQLEARFHEKIYNLDHVNQMLEIYSDFVQIFDNQKCALREYFLEKIQFLISRPETIQLLKKQNILNLPGDTQKIQGRMRFSVYKRAQVNEMKIQQELQNNELNQTQNMNQLLQEYDKVQENIEKQIIESLNNQDELLEKRKMNRKMKTQVMSQSTSTDNIIQQKQLNEYNDEQLILTQQKEGVSTYDKEDFKIDEDDQEK
ncbi:unnamed protein product [Paramecium primaurelia]|uniref:Uncharacterized protein n=1 Tax=Paramecium primaurelia TaxID=5886 RepID=A0A8S1LWD0_PARPR|nr:unnamed protein product [Paramecium primaurelia]